MENIKTAEEIKDEAKCQAEEITTPNIATGFYSGFLHGAEYASLQSSKDKERIQEDILVTEEYLLSIGAQSIPHFTIGNTKFFDLGRNRQLSISCVGTPNCMVFLQDMENNEKHEGNNPIVLHNYDYDGPLYVHKFQSLYFGLTGKTLSGEPVISKDKEEIERLNKEANHWMEQALRKSKELANQQQRIAELEKAQKESVDLLSRSDQTFTKVAGVIAMIRNVAMRPEDSEVSVSEALGVIDIDETLELASAKIKDHLATLPHENNDRIY